MKTLYFYALKDPLTLEIKYIGRTVNISVRYRQHIHSGRCEGKKDKKGSWIKSLLNKNLKPVMDIIEVHETYEINFIKNREMELIAEYSKTCDLKNQRDLVDNGYEFSKESRQKMSNSQKGNTNKKGKTLNTEQRYNCGNGRRGKTNPLWSVKRKPVLQYDVNRNLITEWESIKHAELMLNIKNISLVCNGKRKSSAGFIWEFKETCNN